MEVADYLKKGFVVVSEGDKFITLKKKKGVNFIEVILVLVGFPLLLVMGLGLICWLLAILNYMMRNEKEITISK